MLFDKTGLFATTFATTDCKKKKKTLCEDMIAHVRVSLLLLLQQCLFIRKAYCCYSKKLKKKIDQHHVRI